MTILHLIAAYGICFGLQNDKAKFLTQWLCKDGNFFEQMLSCPYCTGFHAGWVVWLLVAGSVGFAGVGLGSPLEMLLFAFASAGFCYVVDIAAQCVETITAKVGDE